MNKFERFREIHGLSQCIRCGVELTDENHHYYCNDCWRYNQLDKFANELNRQCASQSKVLNTLKPISL